MLTTEQNDRLARVGPGTPGGELLRRYWVPFLPSAKLDEDPVQAVRLLGEDLTCYRDRSGNVGLIGQRCMHRAVDLRWGIPDENGLRCPYHGWMYDETGACVDAPLEARRDMFKDRLKLPGYPVKEMGGLLFAYMGPQPAPLLPPWDLFVWPNSVRQMGIAVLHANWLQCQENTGDPTHGVWLHGYQFQYILEEDGRPRPPRPDEQGVHGPGRRHQGPVRPLHAVRHGEGASSSPRNSVRSRGQEVPPLHRHLPVLHGAERRGRSLERVPDPRADRRRAHLPHLLQHLRGAARGRCPEAGQGAVLRGADLRRGRQARSGLAYSTRTSSAGGRRAR